MFDKIQNIVCEYEVRDYGFWVGDYGSAICGQHWRINTVKDSLISMILYIGVVNFLSVDWWLSNTGIILLPLQTLVNSHKSIKLKQWFRVTYQNRDWKNINYKRNTTEWWFVCWYGFETISCYTMDKIFYSLSRCTKM